MTHIASVALTSQATFGRDGAMFEGFLGFVGQLSLVLWSLVILTVLARFVGIRIYRRGARKAPVETVLPDAAVPAAAVSITAAAIDLVHPAAAVPAADMTTTAVPAADVPTTAAAIDLVHPAGAVTNTTFEQDLQPARAEAALAAPVKVPHRAHRNRRTAHVPAFATNSLGANSTEA